MTIAAGFVCTDGIVLCADTQESYGEDKAYVYKLVPMTGKNWVATVAGAGTGYLVDYANDKILDALDGIPPGTDAAALRAIWEKLFKELYAGEFHLYPAALESKQIQMLIGLCDKSQSKTYLFSVDSTLVRQISKERVIGAGELLKNLAESFQRMKLTVSQATWIAMYLVWEAKQRFSEVGGETLVLSIHSSGLMRPERIWDIAEKERFLKRVDLFRNQLLACLDRETSQKVVAVHIRHIAQAMKISKQELAALDKRYAKQKIMGNKLSQDLAKGILKAKE